MDLPIYQYKDKIIQTCLKSEFTVITGDTGSGKSTQLPQYLFDSQQIKQKLTRNKKDIKIVITQPRRMAAISMAKRICQERNKQLGKEVGYTIRFDDTTSEETTIRYVTDGILVRECLQDPNLSKYQIVILDEAHERSLFTDILFSLVKKAVKSRNGDLQLLVTSATLDCMKFSQFFENCPIIMMEGKCYPVEIKYGACLSNKRVEESVNAAIRMHLHEGPGDVLVFLTGSEECEQAVQLCYQKLQLLLNQGRPVPGMILYSLYGTQASEEQSRVFEVQEENIRKLIFSTNIAETSLTIPNIGFVIDCGFVKQKHYNPRTNMDALVTVPISKVQAIQRAGRAGRTQEGKCFRLYSESYFKQMEEYTVPELLRVNLTNTILNLKSMGIHDVLNFEFMEVPDENQLLEGLKQLFYLSAIDENGRITKLGLEMSRFPLEPSYTKSLLTSLLMGNSQELISLVSLLSSEQTWIKPKIDERPRFEMCQKGLLDARGDHYSLIRIFQKWRDANMGKQFCQERWLNERALKQAENIKVQLQDLCDSVDLKELKTYYQKEPAYLLFKEIRDKGENRKINSIIYFKLALCSGFFYNASRQMINSPESYIVINEGTVVNMDPSSVYAIKEINPTYVIFTELSGTSIARGMMRQVSEIEISWVQPYHEIIKLANPQQLANKVQKQTVRKKSVEQLNPQDQYDQKNIKLQEAKLRYLERKKVKL